MENGIAKLVISLCLTLVTTIAMGQLPAPVVACTSVNAAGAITLTWSQPADPGGIFAGYELYEYNVGTGASSLITTITNYNTTSYTIPGYNGNTNAYCFYLQTDATGANPTSGPSDTICNINLSASAAVTPGIVELSWNFPYITDPASIGGDFTIFMEYPAGTWSIIETLPYALGNNLYNYEVNICAGVLNFQIRHTTGGLCNSFSNTDGGAFSDQIDPTAPFITSVDVDSLTNNATISWAPPTQPDVAGYIVYLCVSGLNATPIQTIFDPTITSWTNPNSMADVFPENYNIAAFDDCFTAGQPDPGAANLTCTNTVFLATQWASCTDFVNLNWLPFEGWPNGVDHYDIYAREEVIPGSGIFNPSYLLASVSGNITTYIHENAPLGSTMYYRVEAFASGLPYTAGSNTRLLTLAYPTPPQFTYISHATVNSETEVEIKVKLDPTVTNPHTYELQRLNNLNTFEPIAQSTQVASNEIVFFDNDIETSEESYTYRVLVTNNCGDSIATSNIGKTILASGLANTHRLVNTIFWTTYEDWDQGVDEYQIFRRIDGQEFPTLVTTMPAGVGFHEDDVSALLYTEGEFCYTIVALETPNTFSFPDASISNEICLTQEPVIWIPNAFVVNGYNNIFLPVISFADFDNYKMEIYSRWGGVIFQSDDIEQGWDGTYNDELVPEGLYAYFISVSDGAGRIFEERGTLTLLISGID